jgi:hypothetical protein
MKLRVQALFIFLFLGSLYTPAQADNANPPKIIELVQVTKGPYKPGDLVTFKIVYSGGNPGLDNAQIVFDGCNSRFILRWVESDGVTDKHGDGVISTAVPACPPGTIFPTYVSIMDKTLLTDSKRIEKLANLEIEISDYLYKPIRTGEIAPEVLQTHSLDLSMIPSNPKIGDSYLLPAVTSVGMPVHYSAANDSPCSVTRDQFGSQSLPGGILKINRNGDCNINIQSHNGWEISQRPSFAGPTINAKGRLNSLGSAIAVVLYEIKVEAKAAAVPKKTTITCVKGKLMKKVSSIKPKCPPGYKVKK